MDPPAISRNRIWPGAFFCLNTGGMGPKGEEKILSVCIKEQIQTMNLVIGCVIGRLSHRIGLYK